jgi:TPR repeat protein
MSYQRRWHESLRYKPFASLGTRAQRDRLCVADNETCNSQRRKIEYPSWEHSGRLSDLIRLTLVRCSSWRITMYAPHRVALLLLLCVSFLAIPGSLTAQETSAPVTALIARADAGEDSARQQLYRCLLHGEPGSEGFDAAIVWLRTGVARDVAVAELVLGYLYEQGRGMPRDYENAAENYQAAALHDNHSAENNLAFLYQHGLGVPKDLHRAFELYLASAQQNDPYAQCNLGSMYYAGSGVMKDYGEAARWFRSAAQLGDAVAQHDLAVFYAEGIGVPVDYKQAAHWEDLSARQGYALAESGLALLYESGRGVPLDYVSAYAWYSRAAATGDKTAAARLKELSGRMTAKELSRAHAYLASLPSPASSSASIEQANASAVPNP